MSCRSPQLALIPLLALLVGLPGCYYSADQPDISGRDIRVTLIHTSDIHSRILPFDHVPMYTESRLGLIEGRGPYGGLARVAHVVKRERARAGRSLWIDTGDLFQGAPIFNLFQGEAELRAIGAAGVDMMALGNHEFDVGAANVVDQFGAWADFPLLAANFDFQEGSVRFAKDFSRLVNEVMIYNLDGLKVAVIGVGNTSSMTSIHESGNSAGLRPVDAVQIIQSWTHLLRGSVDLVVVASHLGLGSDEWISRNVCGLDVVIGGHHHVALDPPKVIAYDPDPEILFGAPEAGEYEPDETGDDGTVGVGACPEEYRRDVILCHPNAFAKFVARLDLVVRDGRVRSHAFELFPIDRTVPEDPVVVEELDGFVVELEREYDLDQVVARATVDINRFGDGGGDSMLGNLVCEAMQKRRHVETDFCVTNSLGMRTDILGGDITLETMFNVLPFDNTITTVILSGVEVRELLDYSTARSAGRGCASQIQVSGMTMTMNCRTGKAEEIRIAGQPLQDGMFYELATNNYMAWGGSGFDMLEINTTKIDTGISMREAVMDYMREHPILPECFDGDDVQDVEGCTAGIGISDGRIKTRF